MLPTHDVLRLCPSSVWRGTWAEIKCWAPSSYYGVDGQFFFAVIASVQIASNSSMNSVWKRQELTASVYKSWFWNQVCSQPAAWPWKFLLISSFHLSFQRQISNLFSTTKLPAPHLKDKLSTLAQGIQNVNVLAIANISLDKHNRVYQMLLHATRLADLWIIKGPLFSRPDYLVPIS